MSWIDNQKLRRLFFLMLVPPTKSERNRTEVVFFIYKNNTLAECYIGKVIISSLSSKFKRMPQ